MSSFNYKYVTSKLHSFMSSLSHLPLLLKRYPFFLFFPPLKFFSFYFTCHEMSDCWYMYRQGWFVWTLASFILCNSLYYSYTSVSARVTKSGTTTSCMFASVCIAYPLVSSQPNKIYCSSDNSSFKNIHF